MRSDPEPDEPVEPVMPDEERRRRRAAAWLFGLAALVALVGPLLLFSNRSSAQFRTQVPVQGNFLAAGTIDLAIENPVMAAAAVPVMAPGDEVFWEIEVRNNGDLPFRYALGSTASDRLLGEAMEVSVARGRCGQPNEVLVEGRSAESPSNLLGSFERGQDPGDRTLQPGLSEQLCIIITLPLGVSNDLQGRSTEQVVSAVAEPLVAASS